MAGIEKILARAKEAQKDRLPADDELRKVAPNLFELLTIKALKDGSARKTSRLNIWAGNGDWTVMLTCESEALCMFAEVAQLADLPKALESLITSPEPPWRQWDRWKGAGAQKGKKSS